MSSNVASVITISDSIGVGYSRIDEGISRCDFWTLLRLHHTFIVHYRGW